MEPIARHIGTGGLKTRANHSESEDLFSKRWDFLRFDRFLYAALGAFLLSIISSPAQGTLNFVVSQTGGDTPLVSSQQTLAYDGAAGAQLTFQFGFVTTEPPAPGVFLDSFTVTLQDSSSGTAVLATIDASGTVWAPSSAGGIVLSSSDIVRMSVMPPSDSPIFGLGVGYAVTVPIPQQMVGPQLNLYFDLFDNQDPNMSIGWYTPASIVPIPEPGTVSLFTLALLGVIIIRRKRIHAVPKR